MGEILNVIGNTPVPSILVVGGLFFILLSMSGQIASKISIPKERQGHILLIGISLLLVGSFLYAVPAFSQPAEVAILEETAAISPSPEPTLTPTNLPPTDTPVADTPTSLPAVVLTQEEKQTYESVCNALWTAAEEWEVVMNDNFNQNIYVWDEGPYEFPSVIVSHDFVDGRYYWKQTTLVEHWMHYAQPTIDPVSNFYLSVDIDFDDSSQDIEAGLIFRRQGTDLYSFGVFQPTSEFTFQKYITQVWTVMIGYTRVGAFLPGTRNTFTVIVDNPTICFFLNDQYIAQAEDEQFTFGNVGVYLTTIQKDVEYELYFDNFELRVKP